MPSLLLHKETSSQQQLIRLIQIRWFYIAVQCIAIIASLYINNSLPYLAPMFVIIGSEILANLYGVYQVRKLTRLTDTHIWLHLLFDTAAISSLLYFNGGATSGFVSVLLLPVTLTALLCSYRRAVITSAIAITCYSFMMKYYAPVTSTESSTKDIVSHHHMMMGDAMQSHFIGMWLTFTVSTLLLVYFISRLSELLSLQQLKISQQQEQQLIDEHIIDLAIASANAAHQLSTPINSMQLAVEELKESSDDPELIQCINDQISRCKGIVSQIRTDAEKSKDKGQQQISINELLEKLRQHWLINFPAISLQIQELPELVKSNDGSQKDETFLRFERGLIPALMNLLDNAVKNQQEIVHELTIELAVNNDNVSLTIYNHSQELSSELLSQLGKQPVNSSDGMGIGFLLANNTIERLGGRVWLTPTDNNMIETQIIFPILSSRELLS